MKKILLLALTSISAFSLMAQDIILFKDKTTVEAIVSVITDETVEYRQYNNAEGPAFIVKTIDVDTIYYENGDIQYFVPIDEENESLSRTVEVSTETITKSGLYSSGYGPHFQAILNMAITFTSTHGGPGVDFILGCRVNDCFFTGVGLGLNTLLNYDRNAPFGSGEVGIFYWDFRGYLPAKRKFMPFIDAAVGYGTGTYRVLASSFRSYTNTLYAHAGLGFETSWFNFSAGYTYLGCPGIPDYFNNYIVYQHQHAGYIRLGIKF